MPTARALALSLALLLDGAAAQWSATGGLGVTVGTGIFDLEAALAAGEWQGGEWTCVMKLAGEPDAASLEDAQLLGYHSPPCHSPAASAVPTSKMPVPAEV